MAVRRLTMTMTRGFYDIVAQLVGALLAALTLKLLFPAAIMTFFLVYSVFGVAVDLRGARSIAGLVIGLTITMDIFAGRCLTGAAMNPARWFGPATAQPAPGRVAA